MTKKEFLALNEKARYDWMISIGWKADESGQVYSNKGNPVGVVTNKQGYVRISVGLEGGQLTMNAHRFLYYFITGEIPAKVDHINRSKHDNRLENLRSVTHQENLFNTDAKGYFLDKQSGKKRAQIKVSGVRMNLGSYDTEEQAGAAYQAAKAKYHKIPEAIH